MVNCGDTYIFVEREELPILTVNALAVAVVVCAVVDFPHTAAVAGYCESISAHDTFALVALTALVSSCGQASQRSADALLFCICKRNAVLFFILGVPLGALVTLLCIITSFSGH